MSDIDEDAIDVNENETETPVLPPAELRPLNIRRGQLKELKIRLQRMHEVYNEYEVIQSRIEALDVSQTSERRPVEDQYYNVVAIASDIIKQHELPSAQAPLHIPSHSPHVTNTISHVANLQAISLPTFSGSYEGWVSFQEIFKSLIHDNKDLSEIQKFYYLQSCLKGEALNILQSLEITESNYQTALDLLKERYENKRILIHNHVKNIVELPNIQKESFPALRALIDTISQNYRALSNLKVPVEHWDTILIFLISSKLDLHTRREWEISNNEESPKYAEFMKFLKNKCLILETLDSKISSEKINKSDPNSFVKNQNKASNSNYKKSLVHVVTDQNKIQDISSPANFNCNYCKQNSHHTYKCFRLLSLSCKDRRTELQKMNICINCLKTGHTLENCVAKNCRACNKRHNSILHDFSKENRPESHSERRETKSTNTYVSADNGTHPNSSSSRETDSDSDLDQNNVLSSVNCTQTKPQVTCSSHKTKSCQILLATATIYILNKTNVPVKCRALLDSASQSNFCTASLFRKLNLKSSEIKMPISGINLSSCSVSKKFHAHIQSTDESFKTNLEFLIIDNITSELPQTTFDPSLLNLPSNIKLADPSYYQCGSIDILLGAEIFFTLLYKEQINLGANNPILHNTKLGWILAGPLHQNFSTHKAKSQSCFLLTNSTDSSINDLNENIKRFWEIENVGISTNEEADISPNKLNTEELECEIHFRKNVERDSSGRYIVKLPFKENFNELGESFSIAKKCLLATERRLAKNPELREYYNQFLDEYEKMGHMSLINTDNDDPNETYYYLPHHPVFKESSSTSKVRVVFNGSSKTSSGLSLNDVLKTGPKVQSDLFDIILRMRTFKVLIVADVSKMFRMVLIHESQRNFQRILWRTDPSKNISVYNLNTIVYGLSPSSYLATRVLNEIGDKCKNSHPLISEIIKRDFYMDDLITGADNLESAISIKMQVTEILKNSGFVLRKWMSNDKRILERDGVCDEKFHIRSEQETKTLGIFWDHTKDIFTYTFDLHVKHVSSDQLFTKRMILSGVAQLFDPLGLINPVVVQAKLILQEVWQKALDWDDLVPVNIDIKWRRFLRKINHINKIQIPRCIVDSCTDSIYLHGFCDSSERAYGAAIYVCSLDKYGKYVSNLLCAKSRLAPLSSLSLPKLELSGALLLTQLMQKVKSTLRIKIADIIYWTDSMIVLSWLNSEPNKWKIFVRNRVAEIQRISQNHEWRHVDSHLNPADILSRGCDPMILKKESLWWHGPQFLTQPREAWPQTQITNISDVPEARKEIITLTYVAIQRENDIFKRWSSYSKLTRMTAYLLRFISNCKAKVNRQETIIGSLSIKELDDAVTKLCHLAQRDAFSKEIIQIQNNKSVDKDSKLIRFNPFLDSDGIIRLGGRLKNANINYDQKYPILLPSKHNLVRLIITYYHRKYLHAGPQFILSQIRTRFWPLNGRNEVRSILKKCITCFRVKPADTSQLMGSLPESRVTPSRPFSSCGVDFAGPYLIKDGKTRSRSFIKAYVCIFICFSTRAVHVELVTELTAEAFLNAFKRFVSRRGLCRHVYSDNATNFVGANNELQRLCRVVKNTVNEKFSNYFKDHRVTWHFIPPRSPHCGGLWEAAVRSFKHHLKRVIGETKLDFEGLYTILTQVEAILNSRPILPLSDDPMDLQCLTPGHFLVGCNLLAVPQEDVKDVHPNRLIHFKQLQQIIQRFWKIWSTDYLHTLQQRKKWSTQRNDIQIGTLVIIKEDNTPPLHWPLGRVIQLHPGSDNLVRVVTVRTKHGNCKRAVTRLCPLPDI